MFQIEKDASRQLHRMANISLLPTQPSKPNIVNFTDNSVTIAWTENQSREENDALIG